MTKLRALLPGRRFGFLYENVDMGYEAAGVVSSLVLATWAGSPGRGFGGCPRNPDDPLTGKALAWGKHHKWDKLRTDGVRQSANDFETNWPLLPGLGGGRRSPSRAVLFHTGHG